MRIDAGVKDDTRREEGEDGGADSWELVEKCEEEDDEAEENDEAKESARWRACVLCRRGRSAQTRVSPQ